MKKLLLLVLSVLLFFTVSFSQKGDSVISKKKKGEVLVTFFGSTGVRYLDKVNDLNKALISANGSLPTFNKILSVTEVGFGVSVKRWYFLFLNRTYSITNSLNYPSISGNGTGSDLRIHYQVLPKGKLKLYPFVGIGTQYIKSYLDIAQQSFSGAVQNAVNGRGTNQSMKLTALQNTLSFGILLDYKVATLYKNLDLLVGGNVNYVSIVNNGEVRINDKLTDYSSGSFGGLDIKLSITAAYRLR